MPVNPQQPKYQPYIPGQALPPGAVVMPGPGGQPVIVPPGGQTPGGQQAPPVPGALPQPVPPKVETTGKTTEEKYGKKPPKGAEILSISSTSGKDRYNVKVQIPGQTPGVSEQFSMSEAEIRKLNPDIPIPRTGIYGFGAGKKWAPPPPSKDAGKRELPDELKDYPYHIRQAYLKGGPEAANKLIDQLNTFSEKWKKSYTAAKEKEFRENIQATREFFTQLREMPKEIQDAYYKEGVEEYNNAIKDYNANIDAEVAEFEKMINAKDFPVELREIYYKKGPVAYNKAVQKSIKELESEIFSEDYPQELRDAYKKGGYDAFVVAYDKYMADYQAAMKDLEPYITRMPVSAPKKEEAPVSGKATAEREPLGYLSDEYVIDIVRYLKDGKDPENLKNVNVPEEDIEKAKEYIDIEKGVGKYTQEYFKERGWEIPSFSKLTDTTKLNEKEMKQYQARVKEATDSYYEMAPEKRPSAIVKEVALDMIPVYGTYRYAVRAGEGGYTAGEIFWIAASASMDLALLLPIVGQISAASRGTYMAGQAGKYLSTGVRAGEATKALGYVTLAEIKAPFTAIAHPIQTAKAALSPIETLLRPKKIPLSAVETKWNTARIPIKMVGDAKDTMKLRDAVTDAMIHSKGTRALINNTEVKLSPAAVNKLGEPVAISTTPDIRPYMDGAIIGKGKLAKLESGKSVILGEGKDLYVSPTLHSRFAEATSSGMRIKDAVPGGLIIRDEKLLAQLSESGKIYAGTAEIEKRLLKGIDLGVPSQYIVTRTPYGKKLTLAVYGKAFNADELAKMKVIGSMDTVKQIFKGPIKVNKKAVSEYTNLADMAKERRLLNQQLKAAKGKAATELRAKIARLDNEIQAAYKELRTVYREGYRAPIRTAVFNTTGGIFRTATGTPREGINIKYYKGKPLPEGRKIPESERRIMIKPPTQPRLPIAPRKLPKAGKGRTLLKAPKLRESVKPPRGRKAPPPPKGRVPPPPPKGRVPPPPPKGRVPPKPPLVKIPRTDAEKRKVIATSGKDVVTYRRGKLADSVWHVYYRLPGNKENWLHTVLIGEPPKGAQRASGLGSAYKTIQRLSRGKIAGKQVIFTDTGAIDTIIEIGGKKPKISFEKDPTPQISERPRRLTPKSPRISPKPPRLTPKTPRLS